MGLWPVKPFLPRAANIADGLVRHAALVAAVVTVLGGFFIWHAPRVTMSPDLDNFILPNDPSSILGKQMDTAFSKNTFLLVAFAADDIFTPKTLGLIASLTKSIAAIDGVEDVVSLANVNDIVGTEDELRAEKLFRDPPTDPKALAELRRRTLSRPLLTPHLVSKDGRAAALLVYLPDRAAAKYKRVTEAVRSELMPWEAQGYQFHMTGWPVTNLQLGSYMRNDVVRIVPITILLVLATVWFVFKNLRLLALASLGIAATLGGTLGLAALMHIPLNNASVSVIPIVIALALSDLVHLFSHLDRSILARHPERRAALAQVLSQILFPCFLTSVNTAIGFASLLWNRIPAIRSFGGLAAAGMAFEFLFTFGLIAPLLLYFRPEDIYVEPQVREQRGISRAVSRLHAFVARRPWVVLAGCLLALAWGAQESRHVVAETNLVKYFRKSTGYRQDLEFVRQHMAGVNTVDISIRSSARDALKDPAFLGWLNRFEARVASVSGVDTAISLADYFKRMHQALHGEDPAYYRVPDTRRLVDQYLLIYNGNDLEQYVTGGWDWTRLRLRLGQESSRETSVIVSQIKDILRELPPPSGLQVDFTGVGIDFIQSADAMVDDQVKNIASAVVSVWLVMVLVLRSVPMALLFLAPNMFPLVLNFGVMGAFGIPLNTGTSLIAATAFGIVVDDTVHFFTRLQERRAQGMDFSQAVETVSQEKGEAAVSSALILCTGFGALSLGHFLPVTYFGILNVFVLVVGLAGDQLFLKSLLVLGSGRKR